MPKPILRAEYKPNCFIFVSGQWKSNKRPFDDCNLLPIVSFVYVAGDVACEWAPGTCGPLQLFFRGNEETGVPHYIFPFRQTGRELEWSQLAVMENGLPDAFVRGDYDHIFSVLEQWAKRE